jgi:hypothetical protein
MKCLYCSHKVKCLYQHRAPALFAHKTTLSSPALVHGDVNEYTSPFFGVLFHGYIPCTWLHECMRISLQPGLVCDWGLVYNAHITHNDLLEQRKALLAEVSHAGSGVSNSQSLEGASPMLEYTHHPCTPLPRISVSRTISWGNVVMDFKWFLSAGLALLAS